jgi:hypothetical protein
MNEASCAHKVGVALMVTAAVLWYSAWLAVAVIVLVVL